MKHNDPRQVENLFHAALELSSTDRSVYLSSACNGDKDLREEVESLIAAYEEGNGFFENPAFDLGMKLMGDSLSSSLVGQAVGEYKILKCLGKGGMGEVYLAEDTRLKRQVSLKFLSPEFVGDNWARRQLIKEAQAAAALAQPTICSVYDIKETGEPSFIVMQYVEGETLADLIRTRTLTTSEVVQLGRQIISAIAEAHAHGIIHRDIKPKNIMVTPGGNVKVLDFGLAKTIKKQRQSAVVRAESASHVSQVNVIPGTVAYMSPEQLRGEKLDYRSDIFSLGTVFYEMACRKNPFAHGNNADVISSILTSELPSLKESCPQAPRELGRIVRKCLEKDRRERYQSASELLIEWDNYANLKLTRRPDLWQFVVRWAAVAAVVLLLAAASVYLYTYWTRPRTLAILPIVNETGDPSLDYLSEGLTESTINQLSGRAKLKVKAFPLVSGYKGRSDLQNVGRELNADQVVQGKIRGTKDAVVLETVMLDVEDGAQRWAKSYPIEPGTKSSVLAEISNDLTSTLEPWSRQDEDRLQRARSIDPRARDEYWRGKDKWRNRDNDNSLKEAIDHFNAAIAIAPGYAEAYAGLADCYLVGNVVSYANLGLTTPEAMQYAERAAKDALARDPNLAEAHVSMGYVYLNFHWDWEAAGREFNRAKELRPDYEMAYYGLSRLRAITGPDSEAIALSRRAKELDPFAPVAALNFCRSYYLARRLTDASDCFDKLVNDRPTFTNGQYTRAFVYLQSGRVADGTRMLEDLYAKAKDKRGVAAGLGYAYALKGNREGAYKMLGELEKLSNIPAQEFMLVYLGLRDDDKTFYWLNRAADDHFGPTAYLGVDPMYDPIRKDPRFTDIAGRHNIPLSRAQ
jgi:serine/threonine protein kinase/Flp pilus assembly protein TadD